jgi:putative ubiquitin-RnfH superfamily antitoxin RatB of RatAB toxin-antitoxin module
MASAEATGRFRVLVNHSPAPRVVDEVELRLPPGATLADALKASGLLERHGLVLDENLHVGIWAKAKPLDTPLREDDRVEIWRGLKVDPKEARRQRYHKQPGKGAR